MKFEDLASQYTGTTADTYEADRLKRPEWPLEQSIMESFLAALPEGSTVLDVPAGTGRFFHIYKERHLSPTGLDISPDMMRLARARASALGLNATLEIADIRNIDAADGSFDAAVCIRFVNWIDFAGMKATLTELARLARSVLIVSVLVWPRPKSAAQWLLQRRVSFQSWRNGTHFHRQDSTEALFAQLGFSIVDAEPVRSPQPGEASYLFYFLRRL